MLGSKRKSTKTSNSDKKAFLPCLRWGIFFASAYLFITLPSSIIYLADRHEYSIAFFIVYYLSFPVHFVLFELLRPYTIFIERLPHGGVIGIAVLLFITAILYFGLGRLLASIIRIKKESKGSPERNL